MAEGDYKKETIKLCIYIDGNVWKDVAKIVMKLNKLVNYDLEWHFLKQKNNQSNLNQKKGWYVYLWIQRF